MAVVTSIPKMRTFGRILMVLLLMCLFEVSISVRVAIDPNEWYTWDWWERHALMPQWIHHFLCEQRVVNFNRRCALGSDVLRCASLGRSTSELRLFLGEPRNIEPALAVAGWPESAHADVNWLYQLGRHTLLICIKDDKCFSARACDYSEDLDYQSWKAAEIGKFAVGRTDKEILSKFGVPRRRTGDREADQDWDYDTGVSTGVTLTFKKHICTSQSEYAIFH